MRKGELQQLDSPQALYRAPVNLFVAEFIGSPAMNLVDVGDAHPPRIGGCELTLDAAVLGDSGRLTVGFRPEALRVGDGPLPARIRTVEDLGSEMFVHVAVEHQGESVPLIAKTAPPFEGALGDRVGLQIAGKTHLFGEGGARIASPMATLRSPSVVT
jgi:multiple sugar transport system ATP-binding protein